MNVSRFLMIALSCICFFSAVDASAQASSRRMTENLLYNRPTVSPYLNLTRQSSQQGLPNYHSMVLPEINRRQEDQQQQVQTQRIQQELSSIRNDFRQQQQQQNGQVSTGRFGWSSRGMPRHGSTLNYYPGFFAPRRR